MQVVKRDGRRESVSFDKVLRRIQYLCDGLDMSYVEPIEVAKKVIEGIYDGVSTSDLDTLSAETAATMASHHPHYGLLAARIAVSNLHKVTNDSFSDTIEALYRYVEPKSGKPAPLIADNSITLASRRWSVLTC
jgi:ribonucleoside-diphosphate reductase alpha chain